MSRPFPSVASVAEVAEVCRGWPRLKPRERGVRLVVMVSSLGTGRPEAGRIVWTISRRLGMVIALALAFLLSATLTIYVLFRSGDTRVPNVIGKSEVEAQKMAEKAGLRVKINRRVDSGVPANTVIETRPAPNSSIKKDSSLTIVVSAGPPESKSRIDFHNGRPNCRAT